MYVRLLRTLPVVVWHQNFKSRFSLPVEHVSSPCFHYACVQCWWYNFIQILVFALKFLLRQWVKFQTIIPMPLLTIFGDVLLDVLETLQVWEGSPWSHHLLDKQTTKNSRCRRFSTLAIVFFWFFPSHSNLASNFLKFLSSPLTSCPAKTFQHHGAKVRFVLQGFHLVETQPSSKTTWETQRTGKLRIVMVDTAPGGWKSSKN